MIPTIDLVVFLYFAFVWSKEGALNIAYFLIFLVLALVHIAPAVKFIGPFISW